MQNVELTATSVEEQAGNEQPQRIHDGALDRENVFGPSLHGCRRQDLALSAKTQ